MFRLLGTVLVSLTAAISVGPSTAKAHPVNPARDPKPAPRLAARAATKKNCIQSPRHPATAHGRATVNRKLAPCKLHATRERRAIKTPAKHRPGSKKSGSNQSTSPTAPTVTAAPTPPTSSTPTTTTPVLAPSWPAQPHIQTWAYDDCGNGGASASAALARAWVTYAEANCGPGGDAKALSDCHAASVTYCNVIQYLDTDWIYLNGSPPWPSFSASASESWYQHTPGSQTNRVMSTGYGGGYLINQSNPAVQSFFQSYVRHNYASEDGLMMDDQSASLSSQLYYSSCGCSYTNEVPSSTALRTAHGAMSAAMTRANGQPYLQIDNTLPANPYLAQGLGMLNQSHGVQGLIKEGSPEYNGVLDPYYSTLLDEIAYAANSTGGFVVPLSYGSAGASYQPRSRRVQEGTMLLGYSPGHLVDWADLEQGSGHLAVWPEEGIYPTNPVQSMSAPSGSGCLAGTGVICSTGGHNDLQVSPGVYRREFGACNNQGVPVRPVRDDRQHDVEPRHDQPLLADPDLRPSDHLHRRRRPVRRNGQPQRSRLHRGIHSGPRKGRHRPRPLTAQPGCTPRSHQRPPADPSAIAQAMHESARCDASAWLEHHNWWRMSYSEGGYGRTRGRSSGEEQTLARYWNVLRERVWVIVACTGLVFAAAVVYVALAPRTYQAQAEMEVQAAGNGDAVLAALPVLHQTGDPTQDVLTAASLVTTQPVAEAVVKSLDLKMSPGAALAAVQATPIGQTGLVAVQATTSSPALSKALANGFVDQRIALATTKMHAAIDRALPTLQAQLHSVPLAQRYGPGSLGAQLDELQQLRLQNDPTLASAAPAALPNAPSSPKVKLSLIAGLFAGLLVGIGAAFLFHALDPRLRREEQLRDRFAMPVLARIPLQPHRRGTRPLLPSELSPAVQEGYRTLRTVVTARNRSAESRAVLVTGSGPAEGKSTTAMGLSAALADVGARVILIEADLRKPTLASSFRLSGFAGLDAVLNGKAELSDAIVSVPIHDASVDVLPALPPSDKAPQLPFAVVERLIDDAKAIADFVVIDSAPLGAVIDALPFAQAADQVLIVARLGETRLNKLDEVDDLLAEHGAPRTGIVLIGDHPAHSVHYYYGGREANSRPAPPVPANVESKRFGKAVR